MLMNNDKPALELDQFCHTIRIHVIIRDSKNSFFFWANYHYNLFVKLIKNIAI